MLAWIGLVGLGGHHHKFLGGEEFLGLDGLGGNLFDHVEGGVDVEFGLDFEE